MTVDKLNNMYDEWLDVIKLNESVRVEHDKVNDIKTCYNHLKKYDGYVVSFDSTKAMQLDKVVQYLYTENSELYIRVQNSGLISMRKLYQNYACLDIESMRFFPSNPFVEEVK